MGASPSMECIVSASWTAELKGIVAEHGFQGQQCRRGFVTACIQSGRTPLHVLCRTPMSETAAVTEKMLAVMSPEQIAKEDAFGMTAFGYAIRLGRIAVIESFVRAKAIDIVSLLHCPCDATVVPLRRVLAHGTSLMKAIFDAATPEDLTVTSATGISLVHALCTPSREAVVYDDHALGAAKHLFSLLPRDFLSGPDSKDRTPLQLAIGYSQAGLARLLLDLLGDEKLGVRDCCGSTPIHFLGAYPCNEGNLVSTVELVLSRASQSQLLLLDNDGNSFLHRVCSRPLESDQYRCLVPLQSCAQFLPDVVKMLLAVSSSNPAFRLFQAAKPCEEAIVLLFDIMDDIEEETVVRILCTEGVANKSAAEMLLSNANVSLSLAAMALKRFPQPAIERPKFDSTATVMDVLLGSKAAWRWQLESIPVISGVLEAIPPSLLEVGHEQRQPCLFSAVAQGLYGWALEILKKLPHSALHYRDSVGRSVLQVIGQRCTGPAVEFLVAALHQAAEEDLLYVGKHHHWLSIALTNRLLNANLREWIDLVPDSVIAAAEHHCDIPLLILRNDHNNGDNIRCILHRLSDSAFLAPRLGPSPTYHFLAILCCSERSMPRKPGRAVSDELVTAILAMLPPEAFLMKDPHGNSFLHSLVKPNGLTRAGLDLGRLASAIAAAPGELLSLTDGDGRTAGEIAGGHSPFPKDAVYLLQPSVKGAGCS